MLRRFRSSILPLALLTVAALPLSAITLASGSISIDGTESIIGPNRVLRNNAASTFAVPKAFPGTSACSGNCGFRTVTVTPPNPNVTVTIRGGSTGINVFAVGYVNSFNPASLATNYLGDPGVSTAPGDVVTFQVTVPAGSPFVLVIMNTSAGLPGTVLFDISSPEGTPTPTGVPAASPLALTLLAILLAGSAGLSLRHRLAEPRL
jgi:hypothetical protein